MSLLVRVDDRLVHGQVVIGWGRTLDLRRIVLVDDVVRANTWEQDLYRMGVPKGMQVEFASVAEAADAFARCEKDGQHTLVLVGSVETLMRLAEVVPVTRVNLGGIHQGPGREERLRYLFLSHEEAAQLGALAERGVSVTAQDVPTATPIPLREVLR
jgi:mannose/fructose/N-acetylgalactosamine-specific phosphotransferase system component IIB